MKSKLLLLTILILCASSFTLGHITAMTSSTDDFPSTWSTSLTLEQMNERRDRFYAVVDSFVLNTGEGTRLMRRIQEDDPAAAQVFIDENCPQLLPPN